MTDISKCRGTDCPLKESCYRYTAKEGMWQSYIFDVPYDKEKKKCEYYWKVE